MLWGGVSILGMGRNARALLFDGWRAITHWDQLGIMELPRRLNWIRNRPWRPCARHREFNRKWIEWLMVLCSFSFHFCLICSPGSLNNSRGVLSFNCLSAAVNQRSCQWSRLLSSEVTPAGFDTAALWKSCCDLYCGESRHKCTAYYSWFCGVLIRKVTQWVVSSPFLEAGTLYIPHSGFGVGWAKSRRWCDVPVLEEHYTLGWMSLQDIIFL